MNYIVWQLPIGSRHYFLVRVSRRARRLEKEKEKKRRGGGGRVVLRRAESIGEWDDGGGVMALRKSTSD